MRELKQRSLQAPLHAVRQLVRVVPGELAAVMTIAVQVRGVPAKQREEPVDFTRARSAPLVAARPACTLLITTYWIQYVVPLVHYWVPGAMCELNSTNQRESW